MATSTPNGGTDGSAGEDEESEQPLRRNEDADPVQIHRDYVERRIGGGAPPTSDAYARALEEFQRMPGAVRTPPSETTDETARLRAERAPSEPEPREAAAETGAPAEERGAGEGAPDEDTGGVWERER